MSDPARTTAARCIEGVASALKTSFEDDHRLTSFAQYLERVVEHPTRYARNSAQYLLDALEYFGVEDVVSGQGSLKRYQLFDAEFSEHHDRVVGNEATQAALVRALDHFVRERRINRLILVHGPNGSAKSSLVACLMRALEAYSQTDEGTLYRFNWVFPTSSLEGGRIGFGGQRGQVDASESYATLPVAMIDSRLPSEHNDNPLFLLPTDARQQLLNDALTAADSAGGDREFVLSDTIRLGDLGHRSRAVYDALLASYFGDYAEVLKHVQVERFFVSRRYRRAAVTVEPQLRVDASARQLTADRSISALPAVLHSQTLFEPYGPLVEGNRGIVEYNDLLKRPMEANKYLLSTSEKGTVSLETGEMHIDAVLIATANETYLDAFKSQPDWASYKGRISLVRMPYLLDFRAEQAIYDAQLRALELEKDVAPHTTFCLALWAVLTRLIRPDATAFEPAIRDIVQSLTPLEKARLYADGTLPDGLNPEQRQLLRAGVQTLVEQGERRLDYEGRFGASPRELKTALLDAAHQEGSTLSPLGVFDALERLIEDASVYEWLQMPADGPYRSPSAFIETVREVYLDRVEREVDAASGLVDPAEYKRLFERYVLHANHSLRKEKIKDERTGKLLPPDQELLARVEEQLGRTSDPDTFRSAVLSRIAAFRIDNPTDPVDFERIFPDLFEKLRAHYHASRREALTRLKRALVQFADDPAQLDAAEKAGVESTLSALADHGYTLETAREAVAVLLQGVAPI